MRSNSSQVQKLKRQQRTPRVDSFLATVPPPILDMADFADRKAFAHVQNRIDEYILGWAEFARQLERDLMMSVPREWKK